MAAMRLGILTCAAAAAVLLASAATPSFGSQVPAAKKARPAIAYVVNSGSGTVTPINTETNKPGAPIPLFEPGPNDGAAGVLVAPDNRTVYVLNETPTVASVTAINVRTNKVVANILVSGSPYAMVITPNGKTGYVSGLYSSQVTPINLATNKPGPYIDMSSETAWFGMTPNGATIYSLSGSSDTVMPISTATNEPGAPIDIGCYPNAIAVTSATAYVACDSGVVPIDVATGAVGPMINAGPEPDAVIAAPNGKTVYVGDGGANAVVPILTATNTPLKPIKVRGSGMFAMTPNGRLLYSTSDDDAYITPIRTSTNTALRSIYVKPFSYAMAITPNGKTVYIAIGGQRDQDQVFPVSVASGKRGRAIQVGNSPESIAITGAGQLTFAQAR
jgi:YVTN family beta-propeller protein